MDEIEHWHSQKFSTGGALISGFPSYPRNPLLIYLIHYVTEFSVKSKYGLCAKIRLDDSCLNHLTTMPVGFTRKSSYIHNSEKSHTKNIMYFADRGAYAPDATCIATPLRSRKHTACLVLGYLRLVAQSQTRVAQ